MVELPDGALETLLAEDPGGPVLYLGEGGRALAAEEGQVWDSVLLVRYPSREHFAAMIRDPAYRAIEHLRVDGLAEAVLQPTTPVGQVAA